MSELSLQAKLLPRPVGLDLRVAKPGVLTASVKSGQKALLRVVGNDTEVEEVGEGIIHIEMPVWPGVYSVTVKGVTEWGARYRNGQIFYLVVTGPFGLGGDRGGAVDIGSTKAQGDFFPGSGFYPSSETWPGAA